MDIEKEVKKEVSRKKLNQMPKHADYAIICYNYAIVVEDTDTAKREDIEKLENSVTWLINEKLRNVQSISQSYKVFAAIHFHRYSDSPVQKILLSKTQGMQMQGKRILFDAFKCRDKHDLIQKLNRRYGVYGEEKGE